MGDYSGLDAAGGGGDQPERSAAIQIGRFWYAVEEGAGGKLALSEDQRDLKAVWAGTSVMLGRAVGYILADPDPYVPVRIAAGWGAETHAATLAGKVHGAAAVDLGCDGRLSLFVLAEKGDRLYRVGAKRQVEDVTGQRKLGSASRQAAWGDFDGDGRLDLASWDGERLRVYGQAADGTFGQAWPAAELPGGCSGLAAFGTGDGRARLVVSAPTTAWVLTAGGDRTFRRAELASAGAGGVGEAMPCLVADLDNDELPDVFRAGAGGVFLHRGKADGTFAAPVRCGALRLSGASGRAFCGDYDADGLLDVVIGGKNGVYMLHNLGGGSFREMADGSGEVTYNSKPDCIGGSTWDVNNDGRQDMVLFFANILPQPYFNRGFFCFGFGIQMNLPNTKLTCTKSASAGQQAAAAADLDGDGGQDLAMVLANGQVWMVFRAAGRAPALAVRVRVAPGQKQPWPMRVVGSDGRRQFGAWSIGPGGPGAFMGRETPGAVTVGWRAPGGPAAQRRIIVRSGPADFALPGR